MMQFVNILHMKKNLPVTITDNEEKENFINQ